MAPSLDSATQTILAALLLTTCTPMENPHPEVHGHRGCRGLLPENTIPAFLKATELGCHAMELDVVLSGDDEVIVSHEPWMSATICQDPDGEPVDPDDEHRLNLYRMTVAEIQAYDCGSRRHPKFPDQEEVPAYKPTLRQVVEATDLHALYHGLTSPSYNVEIKSDPAWYDTYQPRPAVYAKRLSREIDDLGIAGRCMLQSFDPAILEAIHADRPELPLALLVEKTGGLEHDLARLTFKPSIYSPHFSLVDASLLKALRGMDIDLIVWTVNDPVDIRRMLALGVDGIISDHPERVFEAMEAR